MNAGIIRYFDQNGYLRLGIDRKSTLNAPSFLKFSSQQDARSFLHRLVDKRESVSKDGWVTNR